MSEHQLGTREYVFAEADEISVSIGKIEENAQTTVDRKSVV